MQTKFDRLRLAVDSGQMTLFFSFDGRVFGSDESSRVSFAELKNSKDETEKKYINFIGYDLADLANGQSNKIPFGEEEMNNIKVISDLEEVKHMAIELSEQDRN